MLSPTEQDRVDRHFYCTFVLAEVHGAGYNLPGFTLKKFNVFQEVSTRSKFLIPYRYPSGKFVFFSRYCDHLLTGYSHVYVVL